MVASIADRRTEAFALVQQKQRHYAIDLLAKHSRLVPQIPNMTRYIKENDGLPNTTDEVQQKVDDYKAKLPGKIKERDELEPRLAKAKEERDKAVEDEEKLYPDGIVPV
jgi:hypothetical protein